MANGVGEVLVFQKGFRQSSALLLPGDIFQKADATLWKVLPDGSYEQLGAGGGSVPGIAFKDFLFTEVADATLYTAEFAILAGTTVLENHAILLSAWACDEADFTAGDDRNGDASYQGATDLVALGTPYDIDANGPPAPAGMAWRAASEGVHYSFFAEDNISDGGVPVGVIYPADAVLNGKIAVITPSNAPTGALLMRWVYVPPITPEDAVPSGP